MSTRREFITQTAAASVVAAASVQIARAADEATETPRATGLNKKTGKPKNRVLNLAIVGVGDISPRYLKQAPISKRARFVATCARHLDSAKARAAEYGIPAWYDDYAAMYDAVRPDGVVIATPNSLHVAPAIAALERGIAVLCEKPMATTWEDCQAMVGAARRSGAVFLALPYDANPDFLAALEYLNETILGAFTGAEARVLIPGPGRDNWYYDRSVAGGAMLDTMVYPVSRLIGQLGPAHRVTGFANTLIPHRFVGGDTVDAAPPVPGANNKVVESNVDDNITLVLEWASGQQAVLRTLWGTSLFQVDSAVYGRQGTLWMPGDGVIIHSPNKPVPGAESITWNGTTNCFRVPVKQPVDPNNEGLIDHFVDCIQGLKQPICGGTQQLHVHEILFKGYDAARTGQAQTLETTFAPWHQTNPQFYDTRSRPI